MNGETSVSTQGVAPATTNLITRLRALEARIYSSDAHEAHWHTGVFRHELAEAWPLIVKRLELLNDVVEAARNMDCVNSYDRQRWFFEECGYCEGCALKKTLATLDSGQ